jgi:beta-lactamase class A
MLDTMAEEAGFADYPALAAHDPALRPPSWAQIRWRLHHSAALDPARGMAHHGDGNGTTAASDLDRHRRRPHRLRGGALRHGAATDPAPDRIWLRPGGHRCCQERRLDGLVRNEAGVVTFPDRRQHAVAVFTRSTPDADTAPAEIDAGIGRVARALIDELRAWQRSHNSAMSDASHDTT